MKKSQMDRVLDYLNDCGSITQLEAQREFGIMRLGARIWELRHKRGIPISMKKIHHTNRYGDDVWYAKYTLVTENDI